MDYSSESERTGELSQQKIYVKEFNKFHFRGGLNGEDKGHA